MKVELREGQRVKLLGHAIFGYFYGYNNEGKARFFDEETNQISFVNKDDLEETYEKWS
tara:strand:- start:341 stop:514 length:174 start_codon:yes stop_codon:yes gene_type:complete